MKRKFIKSIKIISSILITGALGLDVWSLSFYGSDRTIINILYPVLWIANIALFIHLIAGLIAAIIANTCQKNFFTYGVYTFFIGFIGLWELSEISSDSKK